MVLRPQDPTPHPVLISFIYFSLHRVFAAAWLSLATVSGGSSLAAVLRGIIVDHRLKGVSASVLGAHTLSCSRARETFSRAGIKPVSSALGWGWGGLLTTRPPGESESNSFEPITLRGGVTIPEKGPRYTALVNSAGSTEHHQYHGQGLGLRTRGIRKWVCSC